jgi:hypothetical protein
MPDAWSLVAGLASGGPETRVGMAPGDSHAVIQLSDAEGRPLVSVEAPILVHAPGESERLLGLTVPGPVWWTEIRAATGAEGGNRLAGTIASRLVSLLGGTVWPPGAAARDGGAAAVTAVTASAGPAAAQPAVDVLTEKVAAVICDRPVVAMTAWLSDALRAAQASGRAVQIVTPRGARLTLPTRAALAGMPNRWVVRDGDGGYYDGLSGSELRWQDGAFAATGTASPAFVEATKEAAAAPEGAGQQLILTLVTRAPAARELLLGGALEAVWHRLSGSGGPVAWGTAEPATLPWSRQELTGFARRRAPEPTWFVAVGDPRQPAIATLRVTRTKGGVEEDVTLVLARESPEDAELRALAAELADEHALVSLLVQRRRARADLTVPAHLEDAPVPLAFVLGAEGMADVGREHAARPPLGPAAQAPAPVGPGLYYPLGGWEAFQQLMGHLHSAGRSR